MHRGSFIQCSCSGYLVPGTVPGLVGRQVSIATHPDRGAWLSHVCCH